MTLTDESRPVKNEERLTTLGASLRRALDGQFADVRAMNRESFPAEDLLRDPEADIETSREWTLNRLRYLNDNGLGSVGVPSGANTVSDPLSAVMAFEILSHGDLSVTIKSGVQFGLFGGAVTNLGTAWHHETYLPDITSMKLLGGFAMTELGHGSDVASLETTITYLPETDEYEINSPTPTAAKAYIGNVARDGRMVALFGQLHVGSESQGVHTILVPIRDEDGSVLPGITIGDQGHKGGLMGVDNGTILFDHIRVPRRMLLDRYGGVDEAGNYVSTIENPNRRFFTMLGTLVRGRVCIGAGGGIAARRGLSTATRYALKRRQFPEAGRPGGVLLLDYLVHQRRLLPRIARSYALGFAQNELTQMLVHIQSGGEHTERDQRELESRAAGLKAVTTRFANETMQEAREACGGSGYLSENHLTDLRADVDVFATFEGDNTVLMQLVTKSLLSDYKRAWGELDRSGVVRETGRVVSETMMERTAASVMLDKLAASARRKPDETSVIDSSWHALMFEERERHSLESLARRFKAASQEKGDSFESFNALGDHVQFVARAHMERVALEAFVAGIDACQDDDAKQVLHHLCTLFALTSIEQDRAWYLEHNRISGSKAKAIGGQISEMCRKLRPNALAIVEGMGIPEEWLHAAILDD
ncbi:acyl-CoA dehydrogenase family protein [Demequina aurantiaca]|uniref:acyl-CoA dehydrogenase family protein n=1 Tax=Demequina aurantiaca TaxID=676200 RepID=UPI0007828773|nr:acyl-CoA dehydrogenase [Demequina aurantiaca]